jgi:WD40 repeat protein
MPFAWIVQEFSNMIPSRVLLVIVSFWAGEIASANADAPHAVNLGIRHGFECSCGAQMAFAPDGKSIVVAAADSVETWNVVTGKKLGSWSVRKKGDPCEYIDSVTFSHDGKFLATGGTGGIVTIWDMGDGKLLHKIRAHVVVVDELHVIKRDGKVVKNLNETRDDPSPIVSVVFSPDGKIVAAASRDQRISINDVTTGQVLKYLRGDEHIQALAFLADSNTLLTGRTVGDPKNVIGIWDVAENKRVAQLGDQHGASGITSLSVSGDGGLLVGTTGPSDFLPDPVIRLWDLKERRQLKPIWPLEEDGHATRAALLPDGRYVASVGGFSRLVLWDVLRATRLAKLDLPQKDPGSDLINVAFSPDGKTLAVMATEYTPLEDKTYRAQGKILLIEISTPTG